MIVLDASVLIAYLDGADSLHDAADALLTGAVDDELGASPLTLAEVLVGPARTGRSGQAQSILLELGVESLPFPSDSAVRLAVLRASTRLKLPDCCVLLAADELAAGVASFDPRLVHAAAARGLHVVHA